MVRASADCARSTVSPIGVRDCWPRGFLPRKMWRPAMAPCCQPSTYGAAAVCFAHTLLMIEATISTRSLRKTCRRSMLISGNIRLKQ